MSDRKIGFIQDAFDTNEVVPLCQCERFEGEATTHPFDGTN